MLFTFGVGGEGGFVFPVRTCLSSAVEARPEEGRDAVSTSKMALEMVLKRLREEGNLSVDFQPGGEDAAVSSPAEKNI